MSIDFEKIRLDCANDFKSKINYTDDTDFFDQIAESIIDISSEISKEMLIKYHEQLNSIND